MPKLRNKIVRYLILSALLFSTLILVFAMGIRTLASHDKVKADAESAFDRIEQVLTDGMDDQGRMSQYLTLLQLGEGVSLYAIDPGSGTIIGATNEAETGKSAEELSLPIDEEGSELYATHADVKGKRSYCISTRIRGIQITYAVTRAAVYSTIIKEVLMMAIALVVIEALLVVAVTWYINRYVIRSIRRVNSSLTEITKGNLDEKVDVSNTAEFAQLSSHINDMINSLLSTTDILSYIINKTDVHVGVYVYNAHMKYVRFTDYIPELLNLEPDEMAAISADYHQFKAYIRRLRNNPVSGDKNIYKIVVSGRARYIRIDEAMHHHDVLGVVIDMTPEIEKRRRIESERDMDLLTGLLNRRGMKERFNRMFRKPEELGYGAVFMIDADDLKEVNDAYGHSQGDRYLKALADVLSKFGSKENLSARLGGDEYVVFLYGYESEEALREDISAFMQLQDSIKTKVGDDEEITIHLSLGYALSYGEKDHSALLKAADELMYENKRSRKADDGEIPPLFR